MDGTIRDTIAKGEVASVLFAIRAHVRPYGDTCAIARTNLIDRGRSLPKNWQAKGMPSEFVIFRSSSTNLSTHKLSHELPK
jgi:hypothetical protein